MNEKKLIALGFDLEHLFDHDQYTTKRYSKGILTVEVTYEGSEQRASELTIPEIDSQKVTFGEVQLLDCIVSNWEE